MISQHRRKDLPCRHQHTHQHQQPTTHRQEGRRSWRAASADGSRFFGHDKLKSAPASSCSATSEAHPTGGPDTAMHAPAGANTSGPRRRQALRAFPRPRAAWACRGDAPGSSALTSSSSAVQATTTGVTARRGVRRGRRAARRPGARRGSGGRSPSCGGSAGAAQLTEHGRPPGAPGPPRSPVTESPRRARSGKPSSTHYLPFPFPRNLEQGSFLVSVLLETAAARFQQISLKKGDLTWRANSADGQASVSALRGFPGRAPPKGASAGHRHGRRVQPQGRAPRSAAARRRPARASRRAILLWRACSPAVQGLTSAARAAPQRPVRFWVGR